MTELISINRIPPSPSTPTNVFQQPVQRTPPERFPIQDEVRLTANLAENGTIGPNPDPPDIDNDPGLLADTGSVPRRAEVASGYGNRSNPPSDPTRISFLA